MSTSAKEPVDNRLRILLAAEELFASHGFAATSVREIVQRADVTAPVLYYYFGSKDELLTTLVSERFEEYIERVIEASAQAHSVRDVVNMWCETLIDETVSRPTTLRLILGALWGPPVPHLRKVVFQFHKRVIALYIDSLQRCDPSISEERARFSHLALNGMLNSFMFPILQSNIATNPDDLVGAISPRIVAIIYDDSPIPTATLDSIDFHIQQVLSDSLESTKLETL